MHICDFCERRCRRNAAYLRHFGDQVGISIPTATPSLMNGVAGWSGTAEDADAIAMLENDYRKACEWLGPMSFEDFASGYRAMTEWYEQRSFSPKFRHEATA
jgi:hypothetical protein